MPTSFQQRDKFKPQPEEVVEEFDFIGGLVTDQHETKLKNQQSPNLKNVIFNDTASIKTRGGYRRYNGLAIGAASDEANTGASTVTSTIDATAERVAQVFQVSAQADFVQVDFYMAMNTAGEAQYMQAELWTGSTDPDTLIMQGPLVLVSGTSETAYSFRFRLPYTLAATTDYAVVLKPYVKGAGSTVKAVLVHCTGNSYAGGGAYTSANSGTSWSAITTTDLKFVVYTGGTTGCTGLIRYYTDTGIQQLISKYGTGLHRGDDATGTMTAITLPTGVTLESANFIDWTVVNNTLLVVDAENRIKKYRGSTNANYSTGTITVTNASATITGSGTTWSTVTNAVAGEYIQLPDTKWYKITAVNSATSLTIERTYLGTTLAGQTYVISPWGEVQGKLGSATLPAGLVRPTPSYIENHINRIWTLDGNMLRFSTLDTSVTEEHFNDWDTANNAGAIIIPSGKGDTGTGLYSLGGALYIFQRRAIWRLYGNSPANFELRNITNEIGMINRRTLVEWNDILVFLSDRGVYLFDGSNLRNVTDGVINKLVDSWANKFSPAAVLWKNQYIISYTPSGGNMNSEALCFDLTRQIWGKFTGLYAGMWSPWIGGTDNGEVYFGSSNQGSIYRWDVGGNDDGYEIYTLYETPSYGFGAGVNDKAIKKFYIQQIQLGDWDMSVTQLANVEETTTAGTDINLSAGGGVLWDAVDWDEVSWPSEGTIITTRVAEFQGLAKYFKFKFEQTGHDEGIEILAITATSRLRRLQ